MRSFHQTKEADRLILLYMTASCTCCHLIMAKAVEKLVLFTVSTCGLGSDDLGTDSKEICLLAWQVIDCSKIQVSVR